MLEIFGLVSLLNSAKALAISSLLVELGMVEVVHRVIEITGKSGRLSGVVA